MTSDIRKLLVFDGNNLVRRMDGVPAFQRLSYKGQPTGAIHASVSHILDLIDKTKPDEVAVIFDGLGVKQQKQKVYSGYKAKRGAMQDAVAGQMQATKEILRACGIFAYQEAGHDADDVIGTLARIRLTLPKVLRSVLVASNDKDFFQLCDQLTAVCRPPLNVWYAKDVRAHFGVQKARYFADYLALVGDGVDGIPGLPQCGPKTAREWLEGDYPTLEDLLENYEGKWREKLDTHADLLRSYLKLTRINTRMFTASQLQQIVPKLTPGPKTDRLRPLLNQYGLWNLKNRLLLSPTVVSQKRGIFA